eukprot:3260419-Pleurochrysis_carterae.AAC.1
MSPLRPMPWAKPKWRSATMGHTTRPSRSPTPALPTKVFESSAASCEDRAPCGDKSGAVQPNWHRR